MSEDKSRQELRKTTIGGQALIEGLMMIGPDKKAMAVRDPDGEIKLEYLENGTVSKAETIPFIRGPVRVFKQLVLGTKALMRSAEIAEPDEESVDQISDESEPQVNSRKKNSQKKNSDLGLYVSAAVSVLFSILIFMILPGLIVDGIKMLFNIDLNAYSWISLVLTLIEGGIRVGIFILYLWLVSKMEDIKTVWKYHGAEHKTIACYEARMPLTVKNIKGFSRFHPRCGTSFMFLIMIISIIILAFIGWRSRLINLIIRLLLLPVIASLTYELIRVVGRHDNFLTRAISRPGLAMQKLTTAEPEDSMIEVAIVAMEAVIPAQEGSDEW